MKTISQKLEDYKLIQYGKIALQLRRGLLNLDEATFCWDSAEHRYRELQEVLKFCETDIQKEVFEKGLDSLL